MSGVDEGEVLVRDLTVFCKYNEERHIISISKNANLGDVYATLNEKWSSIDDSTTILQYEEPGEGYMVELCKDIDVENLCKVHAMMGKRFGRMFARPRPTPSNRARFVIGFK